MKSNKSILVVLLAIACLQKYDQNEIEQNKTWLEQMPVSQQTTDATTGYE